MYYYDETESEVNASCVDADDCLVDPICFNDGTEIGNISFTDYKRNPIADFSLLVVGNPRVSFNGVIYECASDMPDELRKLFWEGKARNDERVEILQENHYAYEGVGGYVTCGASIYEPYSCEPQKEINGVLETEDVVGEDVYDVLSDLSMTC